MFNNERNEEKVNKFLTSIQRALQTIESAKSLQRTSNTNEISAIEREQLFWSLKQAIETELNYSLSKVELFKSPTGKIGYIFRATEPPNFLDALVEMHMSIKFAEISGITLSQIQPSSRNIN